MGLNEGYGSDFLDSILTAIKERFDNGEVDNTQLQDALDYANENYIMLNGTFAKSAEEGGGVQETVDYIFNMIGNRTMTDNQFPGENMHVVGDVDAEPFVAEAGRPERRERKGADFNYKADDGVHNIKSKPMNSNVYALRKQVMELIYRAKKLVGNTFPRITVRIVDITIEKLLAYDDKPAELSRFLGFGKHTNEIWIADRALNGGFNLHWIVFHELLHAVGVGHNEKSPLMCAIYNPKPSDAEIDKLFVSHYDAKNENDWNKKYAGKI